MFSLGKKEAMNKDLTFCDDSVNKDGCDKEFYTDTASLPGKYFSFFFFFLSIFTKYWIS